MAMALTRPLATMLLAWVVPVGMMSERAGLEVLALAAQLEAAFVECRYETDRLGTAGFWDARRSSSSEACTQPS